MRQVHPAGLNARRRPSDPEGMRRVLLVLLLILPFSTGCFVLDEIDKGAEIMDQHASKERREAEAKKKASEKKQDEEGGGLVAGLQEQVASLGGWIDEATEEKPPERDPSDTVVRCKVGGKTQYLRKSDCRVRGGQAL